MLIYKTESMIVLSITLCVCDTYSLIPTTEIYVIDHAFIYMKTMCYAYYGQVYSINLLTLQ